MRRDFSDGVRVAARAVDVGYFNTKFTLGRDSGGPSSVIRVGLFPSVAPRLPGAAVIDSPGSATPDGCVVPHDGVHYFVGGGVQSRTTGQDARLVLADFSMSDEYLALLRGALFQMARAAGAGRRFVVESLVLGLPLHTHYAYADALRDRALGDHVVLDGGRELLITVESVHVIVQPQGALLNFNYAAAATLAGMTALVMDPGGGTFDWFLVESGVPNWSRSGAHPQSTLACAGAVADRIKPAWRDSMSIVNRIDHAIRTGATSFRVGQREYAMAEHMGAVDAVLSQAVAKMLSSVGEVDELDQILLTGGGAALFGRYLARARPEMAGLFRMDEDPVFSNVRGFQIAAEMLRAAPGVAHERR